MDYGAERIDTPIRGTISDGDMQEQIIVNIRKALVPYGIAARC